jgi:hydroxymethylpyrimidine/phosphomethylpyrimidine kinase
MEAITVKMESMKMQTPRPYVMSIAGFDPSGGAGVLADIKTFEQLKVYGLGVITANTFQTDISVQRVDWLPIDDVLNQIDILLQRFDVDYFKIGIVRSGHDLTSIKEHIIRRRPGATIIWDPVLSSSSGYNFFTRHQPIEDLLKNISLVTPNLPEFACLFETEESAMKLSCHTLIYLKGGHHQEKLGIDYLYSTQAKHVFEPKIEAVTGKHGSGCILSSAICAHFSLGHTATEACLKSKRYMEKVLSSNDILLGWHTNES